MRVPIGIDLGTTLSVVAHVTDLGEVRVLPGVGGDVLTPSVVHLESASGVVVGPDALRAAPLAPDRVVVAVKRSMGTDTTIELDGRAYRPEGISALLLRALADCAARALGTPAGDLAAVVTVPAYFGTAEREATASAARIAGLDLLDLVAEPVAAALSHGVSTADRGSVLVYDLGGGTFDATVIELTADGPRVVAVDGASRLGGLNFDERLATLLLERFERATGDEEVWADEELVLRVHAEAEDVKKRLSLASTARLRIDRAGRSAHVTVSRAEFEQATAVLVAETLDVVDRVLAAGAARGAGRLGQVLLVGGSSRIPAVGRELAARLGVPVRLGDPDTAVAKGAAIHSRALLARADGARRRMLPAGHPGERVLASAPVRSVVPRALGVKIHDSTDPAGVREIVQQVVAANTPLPVERARATFATVLAGQRRVRVEIMEQAGAVAGADPAFNRRILDGELTGLPEDLPAGSPIDLELSVGTDGRLGCVARERSSGRQLVLESYMVGVADAPEADAQRRAVASLVLRG